MGFVRKPIYEFKDETSTGLDKVPNGSKVVLKDSGKEFIKNDVNKIITPSHTVAEVLYGSSTKDLLFNEQYNKLKEFVSANYNGISGFVDKEVDLEISETNAIVGLKNRFAKFGDEIVDLYGPELVTNGDFSDGPTGWTLPENVILDNEKLYVYNAAHGANIDSTAQLIAGKTYLVKFNLLNITGGGITFYTYGGASDKQGTKYSSEGEIEIICNVTQSGTLRLQVDAVNFGTPNMYLDKVSVREIKSIDLTPQIPEVQTIGSTSLTVTNSTISHHPVRQVDTISAIDVQDSTDYTVTIAGTDYTYTSDSDATLTEIQDGIIAALPSSCTGSVSGDDVVVSAATVCDGYDISVSSNMTLTNTTANVDCINVDSVVGTNAIIPAHNNGHQTKIIARVKSSTNGMEVQILDKSDSNNVIRTQSLDAFENDKTLTFWVPSNADGYEVKAIKRVNDGAGDESVVVSAFGFEDLVTTDLVESGDYAVIDKEELVVNGTFDVNVDGWTIVGENCSFSQENGKAKVVVGSEGDGDYNGFKGIFSVKENTKYLIKISCETNKEIYTHIRFFNDDGATVSPDASFIPTITENAVLQKTIIIPSGATKIRIQPQTNHSYDFTFYIDNISVTPVNDIFRATEDIPAGTSVYDSRFETREYISNQNLVTLKKENNVVSMHSEVLFEDAYPETTQKQMMLANGFVEKEVGLYTKDGAEHLVVGLWQGLNKGAYHEIFNKFGTVLSARVINNLVASRENWYSSYIPTFNSIKDTFGPIKVWHNIANPTINYRWKDTYLTGSILNGLSGRPDAKFYDVVYKNDFIKKFNSIQPDTVQDKQKRSNAIKNGTYEGVSGLVSTTQIILNLMSSGIDSNNNYWYFDDMLNDINYKLDISIPDTSSSKYLSSYLSVKERVFVLINDSVYTDIRFYNKVMYIDCDSTATENQKVTILYTNELPILSTTSHLTTDLIGDPSPFSATSGIDIVLTGDGQDVADGQIVWQPSDGFAYKNISGDTITGVTDGDITSPGSWQRMFKGYPSSWISRLASGLPLIGINVNLVEN